MNKIIGFDIDGVLTDEGCIQQGNYIWHQELCKYTNKNLKKVNDCYDFAKAYDVEKETISGFFEERLEKILQKVKPLKNMVSLLRSLKQQGFKVHLITAREHEETTRDWLDKYGFPYDSLTFAKDKAPIAEKKELELFIEDKAQNALEISENNNIPVVLVEKYHNQHIKENNSLIYKTEDRNANQIKKYIEGYFGVDLELR